LTLEQVDEDLGGERKRRGPSASTSRREGRKRKSTNGKVLDEGSDSFPFLDGDLRSFDRLDLTRLDEKKGLKSARLERREGDRFGERDER